jgi:hypothetical protein
LLAYDNLYEVGGVFHTGELFASDVNSGEFLWSVAEAGNCCPAIPTFGSSLSRVQIANRVLYYSNVAQGRIMARDAFSGTVRWSIQTHGEWGRDFCLADGQLMVLFGDRIEVYEPSHEIFFPHMADGGGQTTLLTVTNTTSVPTAGSVYFLDGEGEPLLLGIEGQENSMSTLSFSIPARSSIVIQTTGGYEVQSGWARVEADQSIQGSSIFQYMGNGLHSEAAVANAPASGETSLFVSRTGNVSTAVAIAVPVNEEALVTLQLLDSEGVELAEKEVTISEEGHLAQFIEEFFPEEVADTFRGNLVIESVAPVVVTAIRTESGLQLSSYEASPTGR